MPRSSKSASAAGSTRPTSSRGRPSRVIMPISLDHEAYLGDRVELIAAEKAGIIKRGCRSSSARRSTTPRATCWSTTAERLGCPLLVYGQDFIAYEENGRMIYQDEGGLLDLPPPRLLGRHQFANAAAAIARRQGCRLRRSPTRRRPRDEEGRMAGTHAAAGRGQSGRTRAARLRNLARWRAQSGRRRGHRRSHGRTARSGSRARSSSSPA